jgi:hypothetical protein
VAVPICCMVTRESVAQVGEQTLSPRPLPRASKVSLTCETRSRVGSTINARKRVTIRDDNTLWTRQRMSRRVRSYTPQRWAGRKLGFCHFQLAPTHRRPEEGCKEGKALVGERSLEAGRAEASFALRGECINRNDAVPHTLHTGEKLCDT